MLGPTRFCLPHDAFVSPKKLCSFASNLSVLLRGGVGRRDLVSETVVFGGETLALLLKSFDVTVLGSELLLEAGNLANVTGVVETASALALGNRRVALHGSVLLLEAKDIKDHGVGAVEDEREEEGEAAKVHVALGVELAGLDFHAFAAGDGAVGGNN